MPPISGQTLGDICRRLSATVERPLGKGAFKEAFLIQRNTGRFALKIAALSPSLRDRFDRESKALQQCDHRAIAKLFENFVHEDGGNAFWVSVEEYLGAGTLEQRLARSPMSASEVRALGLVLLEALDHLKARQFVHRDIKPANILFRDESTPVLTDFGIVRILGAPSLTADFLMQGPGTPLFAAPEQLHNDKALIDWRTDQFGLALVLALAALGEHPFQPPGASPREAIIAVAARVPLSADVAARLDELKLGVLRKALEPWPIGRYADPAEMIEALRKEG